MKKLDFEGWKSAVNAEVAARTGLECDDLDDWSYADDYEDGLTPVQAAKRAIRHAMGRDDD
jgi:hypothetical protein